MTLTQKLALTGILLGFSLSMPTLAGFWPFGKQNAVDIALADNELALKINHALLKNTSLQNQADIRVLSFNEVIMITGTAKDSTAKKLVTDIVLSTAGVKMTGDNQSRVKPNNESTCKKKKKGLYNERRKFNLKNSEACSKISHVYDKILIQEPANSEARGSNWILTAQVKAELLKLGVLEQNKTPLLKIASFDGIVFLLGRHSLATEQIEVSLQSIAGVKSVVPLWVE